jgi:hypothetical protein
MHIVGDALYHSPIPHGLTPLSHIREVTRHAPSQPQNGRQSNHADGFLGPPCPPILPDPPAETEVATTQTRQSPLPYPFFSIRMDSPSLAEDTPSLTHHRGPQSHMHPRCRVTLRRSQLAPRTTWRHRITPSQYLRSHSSPSLPQYPQGAGRRSNRIGTPFLRLRVHLRIFRIVISPFWLLTPQKWGHVAPR